MFADDVGNVSKQLIQFADRLLDLADLAFSLNDEVLLEIDFALLCELWFVQKLGLLLAFSRR